MTKRLLDEKDALRLLYKEIDRAGGQSAWARRSGINRVNLNKMLNGKRPLSSSIVKALNLKRVFTYGRKRRAGLGNLYRMLSGVSA
jgi:DNA-binding phage protein